jgi:hypothetical protein
MHYPDWMQQLRIRDNHSRRSVAEFICARQKASVGARARE